MRHKALATQQPVPWRYAVVGTLMLVSVVAAIAPAPQPAQAKAEPVRFADVQQIVNTRCAMCHNEQVISKNVQLHTPELIAKNAQMLYQQAVVLKAMPMNNATQITDAERALLGRWFLAGAAIN
jgi:uncharacterized membrane protein